MPQLNNAALTILVKLRSRETGRMVILRVHPEVDGRDSVFATPGLQSQHKMSCCKPDDCGSEGAVLLQHINKAICWITLDRVEPYWKEGPYCWYITPTDRGEVCGIRAGIQLMLLRFGQWPLGLSRTAGGYSSQFATLGICGCLGVCI